ncbi:histidine phosphotransferase family protein [Planktomarina temperata]|nr:histidine phosphotransferase family protein [Planktomarina temperata]
MTEKPNITALVAARMCHDLASPIGAIGNGVELVELTGKTLGQEGELVKASVNAAEISAVQTAWNVTGRIHVDFIPKQLRKTDVKTCLLILQSIQVAMPQGAKVVVKIAEGRRIIHAIGPKVTFDEALWSALTHKQIAPDIPPKHVQFAILQALDLPLQLHHSATEMTVSF